MAKFAEQIEIHKEITIPVIFVLGFIGVILIAGFDDVRDLFTVATVSDTTSKFFEDVYIKIGFIAIFLYELIPSAFRLLSTTGFFIGLLNSGINPMVIVLVASVGKVFGFYLLYVLGMFLYRIFKKKNREIADANHWLHKYRLIIFFIAPFFGVLGDIIVVVAGHQRIGFLKIMPFLFLSNILRNALWVYSTIAQIQAVTG